MSSRNLAVADAQPQRYDSGATTPRQPPMTYDDDWGVTDDWDDVPEAEDSEYGCDLEPRCWLDQHPSLSAADRNPSLR
jgi:hypothetical protein